MQKQRHRLAIGAGELGGKPVELFGLAAKAGVHDQRVEADKTPAGGIKTPAVLAEDRNEIMPVGFGDRCRRHRTDRGRIVADVVIARQIAAIDRQRRVQDLCKIEIVAAARAVEADIAAVDDEIGPLAVDVFADPMKVVGQRLVAAR